MLLIEGQIVVESFGKGGGHAGIDECFEGPESSCYRYTQISVAPHATIICPFVQESSKELKILAIAGIANVI
jgi:hypothetical protein